MEKDELNDCLKQVFAYWIIEGNMYPSILAAFHSILEYSGDKVPRQTMQTWVEFAKELASEDLNMPISTFDFLNVDLSVELERLDLKESFFRLYDLSNKQKEAHKIARVRLSLIALIGEDRQRQWVGKFNERIAPYKAKLKRQPDMSNDKKSKAKGFFDLGSAFAQFSAKANEENYSKIRERVASLDLALPEYDRLKGQVWWDFAPPPDWFEGSDGGSFRNYYEMGMLSYLRFLLALPPHPNTRIEQIDASVKQLTVLFKVEDIPTEILDKYLSALDMGDADEANAALRELILSVHISIDVNREDRLPLDVLKSAPSCFDKNTLDAIEHMLKEASVCYENQCYRAAVMLCGNVIETLIKNVYKPVTKNEIYTINKKGKQIERTFKQMCYDLRAQGMLLGRGVEELLDLIYAHRSGATHETLVLNKDEARAIDMLTKNVMSRIFDYFS